MSESVENIVNLILSQSPNLSKDELLLMLDSKKKESHGLLSDEGAVRLVAQQLSVNLSSPTTVTDQSIASVQAGLMDASITGEVLSISSLQHFRRSDGTAGSVIRITLGDSSGQITCACWDSIGEFVANQGLAIGFRVRLEHGYTKYGRAGETEFHLGSKSSIQLLTTKLTSQPNSAGGIAGLRPGARVDRLRLRVRTILPSKSDKGPVQAMCEDQTGLVMVKFWDENKSVALNISPGKTVTIQSPWIREWNGLVDLNVGRGSTVSIEEFAVGTPEPARVGSLRTEPFLRIIRGRLVERSDAREIQTREGRTARVSNIRIEDDTGKIRVSLWDKHSENVDKLRLGDTIKLTGVRIRPSPMGDMEASTVFMTQLEKI